MVNAIDLIGTIGVIKASSVWVDSGCWIFCVELQTAAPSATAYLLPDVSMAAASLYASKKVSGREGILTGQFWPKDATSSQHTAGDAGRSAERDHLATP